MVSILEYELSLAEAQREPWHDGMVFTHEMLHATGVILSLFALFLGNGYYVCKSDLWIEILAI
jgi:hypothetical protein